ncbi:hypothetical protein B0H19DRAFT_1279539 [Mycena capillaripes]|nr:hypothetical protein B0H19DRAFT_1279539 [Mycena capillaripes]
MTQQDIHCGPDNPILWPRLYSDKFCHLAAIPKAPISPQDQEELGVMWWNPTPANFVCPTLTRGLDRLAGARFSKFAVLTGALINKYEHSETLTEFGVVMPFAATNFLEMKPAAGFSPVPATDRLDDHIALVHRCIKNMPWSQNPLEDSSPDVTSTSAAQSSRARTAGEQSAKAGPSWNMSSAPSRSTLSSGKRSPYAAAQAQANAQKEAKGPNANAKPPVTKMLTTITPWATALAAIDRSHPQSCGINLPQIYAMPEPSLLASPEELRHGLYTKDSSRAIYTGVHMKEKDVEHWFAGDLDTAQLLDSAEVKMGHAADWAVRWGGYRKCEGGEDITIWLCMYEADERILAEAAIHNAYIATGAPHIVRACLRPRCCIIHREFFSLAKIGGLHAMDHTICAVLATPRPNSCSSVRLPLARETWLR